MKKQAQEVNLLFSDDNYQSGFDGDDKGFVKIFREVPFIVVGEKLTSREIGIFLYLATNTNYNFNIAKHRNGKPIKRKHLSDELGLYQNVVSQSVSKLIDLGFIAEIKANGETCFVVNPYLSRKSPDVSKQIVDLFSGKINFTKYLPTE